MSLNPLNELKRRLDDDATPLAKRLCLARNIVISQHFPTAPKERIVGDWLHRLFSKDKVTGKELKHLTAWLSNADDLTRTLQTRLIQIVSQYLQRNNLQSEDVPHILSFLENGKITSQLTQQIDDYLFITVTLLKYLQSTEALNGSLDNLSSQKLLNNIIKFYKECNKKLEFVVKLIEGQNLETLFSYLDTSREAVIGVCQNILFPMNKKSFFVSYLQTLIRKDNIDELIAEKGDNIQSVLKIMSAFFTFPNGRTGKDPSFLSNFIDVFVSCFKHESQLIFAFYIMAADSLNMNQSYLSPAMKMPLIIFEENDAKIKRNLFTKMLEILLKNEVEINVRLTDTFGEKIPKVETKKNFTSFLQNAMLGQLKLEDKLDKSTLQIVKIAMKLDPILIEQKINEILPPLMIAKKYSPSITQSYIEMLNCLLEILFKLGRGFLFITQIFPHVKTFLEACNTEQIELKQKLLEYEESGKDCTKLSSKMITGNDIFPHECVETYGKWTSRLLFRQNKELLVCLHKDFEEHCLLTLEKGIDSPSAITLTSVLSAILSSVLRHNKMADHAAPRSIADEFWSAFSAFETDCLGKLGECAIKSSYNPTLVVSFLHLCLSSAHLKLLGMKYSNKELLDVPRQPSSVFDLHILLPCLSDNHWIEIAEKVKDDEATVLLNNLLLAKTIAVNLQTKQNSELNENEDNSATKSYLISQLSESSGLFDTNGFAEALLTNLDRTQTKQCAKTIVKLYFTNPDWEIFNCDAVSNNRSLLNGIVVETSKSLTKSLSNTEGLTKALGKSNFNFASFAKELNMKEYFELISVIDNQEDTIYKCIEVFKQIPLYALEENFQLIAIFLLMAVKKCSQKKLKKTIDGVLQSVFELSPKYPDLYKIFPLDYIFFEDHNLLTLLTLKIKSSDNLLIIKSVLETAVKKVKTEDTIVKNIVESLLRNLAMKSHGNSIEYFSNPIFQISCILLPLIAKEKKAITTSAYRSILANLQEKLHKSMLECFKNINVHGSAITDTSTNTDDSMVGTESMTATLNAMDAYSLTLSKYCETRDEMELKNLDYLLPALEFFVGNAITSIQAPSTKSQNVVSSIQLLNVALRHIKKLEAHPVFQNKDVFVNIWKSIVARLLIEFDKGHRFDWCEDISVTLKFVCELMPVEQFNAKLVTELDRLTELMPVEQFNAKLVTELDRLTESTISAVKQQDSPALLTSHKINKFLWTHCLKANLLAPKCAALSRLLHKMCKTMLPWIQQIYENEDGGRREVIKCDGEPGIDLRAVHVDDIVCELLKIHLDTIAEAILAAKKISLDYKCLDSIFELHHLLHLILGRKLIGLRCEVSWQAFCKLYEGCLAVLNNLLVSREELLEDRWPCYMQCYRALVSCMCARASADDGDDHLSEIAHNVEKLTQSITKRKAHVSRIAAYSVADLCSSVERAAPSPRPAVRQHLDNSIALLLQASDSSYSAAFLRRALVGLSGHTTMTNMYTMYKRYHKYVGNS